MSANLLKAESSLTKALIICLTVLFATISAKISPSPPLTNLLAFWDFQEATGQPRVSKAGQYNYVLHDINASNPVAAGMEGVWGSKSAYFTPGQRLSAKRELASGLTNISGTNASVSIVAWIKREKSSWSGGAMIAGVWNEYKKARQYALFLNLGVCDVPQDVIGHVSAVGGPTPGQKYCTTRACGGHPTPFATWLCVGMSYDGEYARAYLNGSLDLNGKDNPYYYPKGLYTPPTASQGADFDVGANLVNETAGGPALTRNLFAGYLGGLAVYGTALSDQAMADVCQSAPGM
eukprot:m.31992 g.31992  ORF g.31992 m.31992 type:complete len:292 (+) comp12116_c0_seq1:1412-2287(+)